jgi:hypothetical protein
VSSCSDCPSRVELLTSKANVIRIGTLYNALPGQNRKDMIEKWAKELYPAIWAELEKLGQITAEEGHRLFKLPKENIKA